MSTASRYCEAARGARAGGPNAAFVPGDSGKTRRHYDWRTTRYRDGGPGNLDMRSKREPEAEIAAPLSRAPMPVEYSGLRGARLRHSPPFFPRPPPHPPPRNFIITEGDQRDGLSPRRAA